MEYSKDDRYAGKAVDDMVTNGCDYGYGLLYETLNRAASRAVSGKGKERHADGDDFLDQQIFWIERNIHSFCLGQAVKKVKECQAMDRDSAVNELLDAIVYISARIIELERECK